MSRPDRPFLYTTLTWALITFLVYAVGLHSRQLKLLQHPRVFRG